MQQLLLVLCVGIGGFLLQTAQANNPPPVELLSYNYPDYYIGHRHGVGNIQRQIQPVQWKIVTPGLCGIPHAVSLQLATNSNVFLRHRGFLLYADPFQSNELFKNDACFYLRQDKWIPGYDAFESVNFPGRFIRHQGFHLKLHPHESTAWFEEDASFHVTPLLCEQIQSQNYPSYYFGLRGDEAFIEENSDDRFVPITPGLSGHAQSVSFRSCSDSTKFLRHRTYDLYADTYESTELFRKDATFIFHPNKWFDGFFALESVNFHNYFIRHQGFRLKISYYDGTEHYKKDASFKPLR